MRLIGFEAIEYAERAGLTLHKSADSIDDSADELSVAEAEAIADSDPDSIWLEVPSTEYYGQPRNMEPGSEPAHRPKLAGQRPDELLPSQDNGDLSRDEGAIGTPGGGLAAGGLAGTNAPSGRPEEDLQRAMAWGVEDRAGDEQGLGEPQSGPAGGAIGGTPAGKRAKPK
jgi:hypothetical protein